LSVAERKQIQDRKAGLKEKSASKREQRQVYLSIAERKQIQDRKAGLKEKDHAVIACWSLTPAAG
jgi:hypothetical protein